MAHPAQCCLPRFSPPSRGPRRPVSMRVRTAPSQNLELLAAWRREEIHSLLQTAWALLLYRYIGSKDVCFGYQYLDGPDTTDPLTFSLTINEDDSLREIQSIVAGRSALPRDFGADTESRLAHDGYMLYNTILMIRICCDSSNGIGNTSLQPVLAMTLPDKARVRLHVKILENDISMFLESWNDEVSTEQMKSIASYFERTISQILSGEDIAVEALNQFSEQDWSRVCQFNAAIPEKHDRCIHEKIQEQALIRPDSEAVCAWDGSLTYRELDHFASRVAFHLQAQGVGPEVRVALCFDKSKWNIVAVLGVLKAGGAFVPLDPTHPTSRLQSLVRSVQAKILICSRKHEDNLKAVMESIMPLDEHSMKELPALSEERELSTEVKGHHAAYVIFTSGSTGEPKGTLIEHNAFASGAAAHAPRLRMSHDARVLQFAAHTFDASLIDILTTLIQGGCICVPSEEQRLNEIVQVINEMRVNHASLTPTFVDFVDQSKVPGLKTLVLAGEAMSQSHLNTWSKIELINAFGPTECSVAVAANNKMTRFSDCRDIGLPIGVRPWLVDPEDHDKLVPVGCVGEMILEGPTLARGYINNPEKTAEVFIHNPVWAKSEDETHSDRRFYKTGDLVRYNSDAGSLTYIGRKDTQIKLHGQRIELGEIEDNLNTDPAVKNCLVFLPKSGFYQGKLVAVLSLSTDVDSQSESDEVPLRILEHSKKTAAVTDIRHRLSSRLPTYMIPSGWLCVESLPQLASRKLDRKATASWVAGMEEDPDRDLAKLGDSSNQEVIRSTNVTEDRLASIWSRILNIPKGQISLDESFLALGGDSIAAITCMGTCKKQGLGVTVQQVLQSKSIRALATHVTEISQPTVYEETIEEPFGLSPIQKLHFKVRKEGQGYFNQGVLTRLNRPISDGELCRAIETLIKRHSMLRTRFTDMGAEAGVRQRITEDIVGSYRFRSHSETSEDEIQQAISSSQSCINAFAGPMMAADIFRVSGTDNVLSMTAHHLVVDIVSWRIILEDLEELLLNPSEDLSQSGSLPFQTWSQLQEAQSREVKTTDQAELDKISAPDFAYWGLENNQTTYGDVDCETFEMSPADTHALLMECHKSLGTEPIDIFLASLLYGFRKAFTDRSLPVIYNEGHGREVWDPTMDISRTVGWFTILQPMLISNIALDDPVDAVIQVKDLRRQVSDNGRQDFTRRVLAGGPQKCGHHGPMEISFNYVGQHRDLQRKDGLFQLMNQMAGETGRGGGAADFGEETPRFALFETSALAVHGRLRFSFSFNRYMKHQDLIRNWVASCHDTLKYLGDKLQSLEPRPTLSSFPLLSLNYEELDTILSRKLPSVGIHSPDLVEDIYPCSRMQEAILLSRSRDDGLYAVHDTVEVKCWEGKPDANRLSLAWQKVVSRHPMLRTIFVENFTSKNLFCQVVLKEFDARPSFVKCLSDGDVLATLDRQQPMNYHEHRPSHRLTICETANGRLFCRIEMSHTSMDGSSISLILRDLQLAYSEKLDDHQPMFKNIIDYLQNTPQQDTIDYWCSYLSKFKPCHLPVLTDGVSTPKQLKTMRLNFEPLGELQRVCEQNGLTLSTAFSTGWGLTLKSFCNTDEVCFSYMTSLRDLPVEDIESVVGPVISLLACRMNTSGSIPLKEALNQVQNNYMEQLPYKNASLIDIQHALKLSETLFNTGISFRKLPSFKNSPREAIEFEELGSIHDPAEFPVFINVEVADDEVRLDMNYWTTALSDGQAQSVARTFLKHLENIVYFQDKELGLLDGMSDWAQNQIAKWNDSVPMVADQSIHELLDEKAKLQPNALALVDGEGSITYAKINELSSILATYLIKLGVSAGSLVPIDFANSSWQIVSVLAVLKAGGLCVPMSGGCIQNTDQWLIDNGVQVALATPTRAHVLEGTVPYVIPVGASLFQHLPSLNEEFQFSIDSSNKAYVVFTSGETSTPRPVVLSHRTILARAKALASALCIDEKTRFLQFSAYTSDMFIEEIFSVLLHGGSLCIPPDNSLENLSVSIKALHVNCISLTPTIASYLQPSDVPEVKSLALFGEAPLKRLTEAWSPKVQVHTFYGTAESSSMSIHKSITDASMNELLIGASNGCLAWIVDPSDHDSLVPIGCTGELVLEGPVVAEGYLNGEKESAGNFIVNPKWLIALQKSTGNSDDATPDQAKEPRRMFKTGDLARYNSDGSLVFMGRKSKVTASPSQAHMWQMEQRINAFFPPEYRCAVENLELQQEYPNCSAVFVLSMNDNSTAVGDSRALISGASPQFHDIVAKLHTHLSQTLPSNQIPNFYFPVSQTPLNRMGRLDRQTLRKSARSLSDDARLEFNFSKFNEFWRGTLANSAPSQFPSASTRSQTSASKSSQTTTSWSETAKLSFGSKTTILAAWALTVYGYTSSEDVCFGELLLGQDKSATIVPRRLIVDEATTIGDFLIATQQGLAAAELFQKGGLQRIYNLNGDTARASNFRNLVLVSNNCGGQTSCQEQFKDNSALNDASHSYPLVLCVTIGEEGIECSYRFDEETISAAQVDRIMARFGDYFNFLNSESKKKDPISSMAIHDEQNAYSITADMDYWKEYLSDVEPCIFHALPAKTHRDGFGSTELEIASTSDMRAFCQGAQVDTNVFLQVVWGLVLRCFTGLQDVCFGYSSSGQESIQHSDSAVVMTCRLRLMDHVKIEEAVQSRQREFKQMLRHPLPLSEVQQELGIAGTALFNTIFSSNETGAVSTETLESSNYMISIHAEVTELAGKVFFTYQKSALSDDSIANIIDCFGQTIDSAISIGKNGTVGEVQFFNNASCQKLLEWNSRLSERPDKCAHEIIGQQVLERPSELAICSWDGDFTYAKVDDLSTRLASHLRRLGVKPEVFVAMCFEKSAWAIIAQLAVHKAGGAFASMDPSHPESRLKGLVDDIGAKIILCSSKYLDKASKICGTPFSVCEESIKQLPDPTPLDPALNPTVDNAAYVIFTSGTTGKPKVTVLEHVGLALGCTAFAKPLNFSSNTRMLQFSSFTFDISVLETLVVLMVGGCICMPSDEERLNDLPGMIRRSQANTTCCTPSIINTLDPKSVPGLTTIACGGEKMMESHIERWADRCVINAYGPSEATIVVTSSMKVNQEGKRLDVDGSSIGTAMAGRTWIVDPNNHHRLLPVGAIGELVLEGCNVARGYLNNEQKTKQVFIRDPEWTKHDGLKSILDRRDRMYLSGDLVYYSPDGTIQFISRKDTQIKLNGVRIEVEEIEQQCISYLSPDTQVAVDVINPKEKTMAKCLGAFFTVEEQDFNPSTASQLLMPMTETITETVKALQASLRESLPLAMMPKLFFPLRRLPFSSTGKLDRKGLRVIIDSLSKEQFQSYTSINGTAKQVSQGGVAGELQGLWEKALGLAPGSVGAEDSFFGLGGDSFSAMKLVGVAHSHGISLTVADIYANPVLTDMAKCCGMSEQETVDTNVQPFSLLSDSVPREEILADVSEQSSVPQKMVSDIYPCSPVQEGLLTLSIKQQGAYIAQPVFELAEGLDIEQFKAAWQETVNQLDILRTRIVHTDSMGFVQAVLKKEMISWTVADTVEEVLDGAFGLSNHNGGQLASYAIVQSQTSTAQEIYSNASSKTTTLPYKNFISYLEDKDMSKSDEFWEYQLSNLSCSPFPQNKSTSPDAVRVGNRHHSSIGISRPQNTLGLTLPEIIRAAWAIVVSVHTSSEDVCFGETLMGRNISLAGVTDIAGPVLTTVPTRVQVYNDTLVTQYLQKVRELTTVTIPHQHSGLQRIRKLSSDASIACDFQNLLVIQSEEGALDSSIWASGNGQTSGDFFTHPLTVECKIKESGLGITLHHDEVVLDSWLAERLIHQFGYVLEQLLTVSNDDTRKVGELELLSAFDKKEISLWNQRDVPAVERCVHDIIKANCSAQPKAKAVHAWDGELSYKELYDLASTFANYLSSRGVGPETLVPICMDKSLWVIVSILGVLIAGGAYVPLDPSHPTSRHSEIFEEVDARVILCSPQYRKRYAGLVKTIIPVSKETIRAYGALTTETRTSRKAQPSNMAVSIFTSGSTGRPKGIILEHRALASSGLAFGPVVDMNQNSRSFQFASLAFDAAILETLVTLMHGGCICIPSEEERLNDVVGAIQRMGVTWTFLTPSIASIIEPSTVPSLEVLVCGGEKLSREVITKWAHGVRLMNGYGPTETTIFAVINPEVSPSTDAACIGNGIPCTLTWIVDPENHDRLSPLGAIGELALEGPALAREYLRNPEKTAEAFVTEPAWMKSSAHSLPSPRRIYKTGDLVKYNPDGSIVCIGRKDHQVKLHGQRMELGEIEHRLHEDPRVRHAIVIMPAKGLLRQRLVTIMSMESLNVDKSIMSDETCELVNQTTMERVLPELVDIQKNLETQLPIYMVPQTWAVIKKLPMLVSGKLDRKRITSWIENVDERTYSRIMQDYDDIKRGDVEPEEEEEEEEDQGAFMSALRDIFSQVLNISSPKVDLNRSFVSLGGDSITGMAVVSKARKQGIEVTLHSVLQSKSITELAAMSGAKTTTIQHKEKSGELFDLSPIQKLYFDSATAFDGNARFNQSMTVRVTQRINLENLEQAIKAIIQRHSMFRARFIKFQGGKWQQKVKDDIDSSYRFRIHAVNNPNAVFPIIRESQQSLDIENGPIFAANLFEVQDHQQILFLVANHLCVDMVSWRIVLQDIEEFLESGSLSSEKPLSFQSWCEVQMKTSKIETRNIELPFEIETPNLSYWGMENAQNVYGNAKMESFTLSEDATAFVLERAQHILRAEAIDVVLSTVIHAFRQVFMDRDIPTIYNEGHGRDVEDSSVDLSRTVGWFTTICPLRVNKGSDIIETLKYVKDTRRQVTADGQAYFAQNMLHQTGATKFPVPFEIIFNYLGQLQQLERDDSLFQLFGSTFDSEKLEVAGDMGQRTPRFALLEISAIIVKEKLHVSFTYNRQMKHESQIMEWMTECKRILEEDFLYFKDRVPEPTLTDYPLLNMTYDGLRSFVKDTIPSVGMRSWGEVEDVYPCSPVQEGILLSQLRDPQKYMFHVVFEVHPYDQRNNVDPAQLRKAWMKVVNRHQVLRTLFVDSNSKGGSFDQLVIKSVGDEIVELHCEDDVAFKTIDNIRLRDINEKRSSKLPQQLTICQTTSGRVFMKLEMNHAIIDGGSVAIVLRDLALAYNNILASGSGPRFSEYIRYARKQDQKEALTYWMRYLSGVQPCHLSVSAEKRDDRQLGSLLMDFNRFPELQQFCEKNSITLANLTMTAWAIVLRKFTRSNDVSFGYPSAGRDSPVPGIQDAVGIFINMLCCRVNFAANHTLLDVSKMVQENHIKSIPHQNCSLAKIQHQLDRQGQALFNTTISIQNHSDSKVIKKDMISFDTQYAFDPTEYPVTVNVETARGHEGILLRFWTDAVSENEAKDLADSIAQVFTCFVEDPSRLVSELTLAGEPLQIHDQPPKGAALSDLRLLDHDYLQKLIDQRVNEAISQMIKTGKLVLAQPDGQDKNQFDEYQLKGLESPFQADESRNMTLSDSVPTLMGDKETSELEDRLRKLWNTALGRSETAIKHQDSFFKLGGDSITAMKMVGVAREEGLVLTVADVFNNPVFGDMLAIVSARDSPASSSSSTPPMTPENEKAIETPFILSRPDTPNELTVLRSSEVDSSSLRAGISPKIGVFRGGIADVLPVTDFQALSLTASLFKSRWMLNYFFLDGQGPLDIRRLRESFLRVVDAFDILRTVFVCFHGQFFQVILRKVRPEIFVCETDKSLDDYTESLQQQDRAQIPRQGEQYVQFYIVKKKISDQHRILIRMHHAQFDGVCLPRIMSAIKMGYEGSPIPPCPSYSNYMRVLPASITPEHYQHWKTLLKGSQMTEVIRREVPNNFQHIGGFTEQKKTIHFPPTVLENVTIATVMQSAWAMTLAKLSAHADVVFGLTISGRNATIPGIEATVGPCLNMIPVRVKFGEHWTGLDLFRYLQDQQVANMPYESLGFREIIRHCTDWSDSTYFTTSVFHQNVEYEGQMQLDDNNYRMGGVGVIDNFTDLTCFSKGFPNEQKLDIALGYSVKGPIQAPFATQVLDMVCETVQSLIANPNIPLPSPSTLRSLSCQVVKDLPRPSDELFLSSHLNTRSISEILVHSDLLTQTWQQVLSSNSNNVPRTGRAERDQNPYQLNSSFFDLGGDILSMAQVVWLLEQEGHQVRLEDLLEHPTFLGQLAVLALHKANAAGQDQDAPRNDSNNSTTASSTELITSSPPPGTVSETDSSKALAKKGSWNPLVRAFTLARRFTRWGSGSASSRN
ncbi:nonribosomal peptide synthase Pes1 [Aspergillus melleus]|uniref:nonribosomal peptide synthase Pes1 n=1 Tax=Aspergillus melleus TaxID=138277 RepID=UPI001E8DC2A4|nr:uncharacterized protein LDX57_003610 [Aspergillus melleus]KAH8425870.1 hypothetical protein LDX57_003610 [Aspergillus melleus]